MVGPGRFEVLGKYAHARFRDGITPLDFDYDQDTTEVNFNYVIDRIFYVDELSWSDMAMGVLPLSQPLYSAPDMGAMARNTSARPQPMA